MLKKKGIGNSSHTFLKKVEVPCLFIDESLNRLFGYGKEYEKAVEKQNDYKERPVELEEINNVPQETIEKQFEQSKLAKDNWDRQFGR